MPFHKYDLAVFEDRAEKRRTEVCILLSPLPIGCDRLGRSESAHNAREATFCSLYTFDGVLVFMASRREAENSLPHVFDHYEEGAVTRHAVEPITERFT